MIVCVFYLVALNVGEAKLNNVTIAAVLSMFSFAIVLKVALKPCGVTISLLKPRFLSIKRIVLSLNGVTFDFMDGKINSLFSGRRSRYVFSKFITLFDKNTS